jgi:hypothetical protein
MMLYRQVFSGGLKDHVDFIFRVKQSQKVCFSQTSWDLKSCRRLVVLEYRMQQILKAKLLREKGIYLNVMWFIWL